MLKPDGTLIDTDWSAIWAEDQHALFCVIRDITERKKLEQLKQDFVAMLSHDLRTPLSSVLASIELISLPAFGLNDEAQSQLVKAERNLHAAISLINELLELEKMDSGVLSLEYEDAHSHQIMTTAANSVEGLSKTREVSIVVPNEDIQLTVDGEKITRVLVNLLGNALKFSQPGQEIVVKQEVEKQNWRVSVTDSGSGVPADKQEMIFERFRQIDQADKGERVGTGLGLAICKSIVEAHRGKIGVISQAGAGSTFWFEIPLQRPAT
jgi:signal transduction histidine kinase